ncbi:MAG: TIGR03118 family protein [Massilia sp.]
MKHHLFARQALTAGVLGAVMAGVISCGGGSYGGGGASNSPAPTPAPPVPTVPVATASKFASTALVSDGTGAAHTDAKLVNAWGIAFNPTGFVWVNNNGSNSSTLYDGNGVPQTLVVGIPAGTAGAAHPTGIVFNSSTDFKVTQNGVTGAAAFIFVGEAGTVSGWSPAVNRTASITVVDGGGTGPVYKGLAIGKVGAANFLYAADFRNGAIDVFDGNFAKVSLAGSFRDPNLPTGYAPFNIQAIGDKLYVAYARRATGATDESKGAGFGVVALFDTSGNYIKELTSGGVLNAPWGLTQAPANLGTFSNAILVGNFGDGKINAFDPNTGAWMGALSKADGNPVVIDGLWGLAFGNGVSAQPVTTLFYTAGPGDEAHGAYGRLDIQ